MPAKRYIIPFILFLSLLFNGLVIGTMIGSLFVPAGSGLAGPAIALSYGIGGTLVALLIGIIFIKKLSKEKVKKTTLISSILAALLFAFLLVRYLQKQEPSSELEEAYGSFEKPANRINENTENIAMELVNFDDDSQEFNGMGIVKPLIDIDTKLYFYAKPDYSDLSSAQNAIDSLTFKENNYTIDIATAPPWFVPEYMKMDYQILHLKAISIHRDWIEIEGNKQNGKTVWLDRKAVNFSYWPDFLLEVFSVEPLNPQENYLRIKPIDHASKVVNESPMGYSVIAVKGHWAYVSTIEDDIETKAKRGWIKWKDENHWLVRYHLLS